MKKIKPLGKIYWQIDWYSKPMRRCISIDRYDYCIDKQCNNASEHEYYFDGQIFYKPKVNSIGWGGYEKIYHQI